MLDQYGCFFLCGYLFRWVYAFIVRRVAPESDIIISSGFGGGKVVGSYSSGSRFGHGRAGGGF